MIKSGQVSGQSSTDDLNEESKPHDESRLVTSPTHGAYKEFTNPRRAAIPGGGTQDSQNGDVVGDVGDNEHHWELSQTTDH